MRAPTERARGRVESGPHAALGEPTATARMRAYWINHARTLLASLGRLWRAPVSSLMTVAVIGIALALPAGLHVLLDNAQRLSAGWDGSARISLFLKSEISDARAAELARSLRGRAEIAETEAIARDQALAEFRQLSGFGDALRALDQNPLPAVLVVRPGLAHSDPIRVEALVEDLRRLPEVDLAQLDLQWLRRLHAIMAIAQRAVLVLGALLGLAVLLIVGNTIRLEIQNRRPEIEVIKLVGATDAFVRRPFLYGGLWYGLFGGLLAWLMVTASLTLLDAPVRRLAELYRSGYDLRVMDAETTLVLFGAGALLGLLGSWIAVGRHLKSIEPA